MAVICVRFYALLALYAQSVGVPLEYSMPGPLDVGHGRDTIRSAGERAVVMLFGMWGNTLAVLLSRSLSLFGSSSMEMRLWMQARPRNRN